MDEVTGTDESQSVYTQSSYCAHAWVVFKFAGDGQEHKYCALCGADLGIANYAATNTGARLR